MSTRCNIQVKDSDGSIYPCMIYRHFDGYPEGVLPFLKDFTERFRKDRGVDPEYFVAQYLRHLAFQEQEELTKMTFYQEHPEYQAKNSFTGYGVCTELHGDIEHLYIVDLKTGKIRHKKV